MLGLKPNMARPADAHDAGLPDFEEWNFGFQVKIHPFIGFLREGVSKGVELSPLEDPISLPMHRTPHPREAGQDS